MMHCSIIIGLFTAVARCSPLLYNTTAAFEFDEDLHRPTGDFGPIPTSPISYDESDDEYTKRVTDMILNFTDAFGVHHPLRKNDIFSFLQPGLNSDPPMKRAIEINLAITNHHLNMTDEEKDEYIMQNFPKPIDGSDLKEFYWSVGFALENLLRKRNATGRVQPKSGNLPFSRYLMTSFNLFDVEDLTYYANFSVEAFVEEMVAQSELGESFRKYYEDTGRIIGRMYTLGTTEGEIPTSDNEIRRYIAVWRNRPLEAVSMLTPEQYKKSKNLILRAYRIDLDVEAKLFNV